MDTNRLKTFAQRTRIDLMGQVARKLDAVLAPESDARREAPEAIRTLEGRIKEIGRQGVIEQVAYTWFNRFTALRYMDVNGYLTPMVVSPAVDRTRPEILDQAAAGAIPDYVRAPVATRIRDLLEGRAPSREPQVEAYRLLLVAACNDLSRVMPFLFEAIADYTELLMPNELLAADGWVARMREVMTEDACRDVEIIGWLYQFYISEKKDQVFAGLKKNQKITAENIPAATQLFTPHWIVRYLVENSLGRLWLLNRPQSKLAAQMDYYIAPEEPETDFLRIGKPEEIKVCDPACGSGHMLTYAFDLLYAIYEEEGYDPTEIPALILTHNLTGVEIDDRAGALAAFALAMKAAAKLGRRRFLRMEAKPDIVVLQNVAFTPTEMQDVAAVVGKDLFNDELGETLGQFEEAKNFGSLIVPKLRDPAETLRVVEARDFSGDLLLKEVQARVAAVLRMAEALSPKYHLVVANPPYMGGKGMNAHLGELAKKKYFDSKQDLFAMFMERAGMLSRKRGLISMINMQSWMFLSSYEKLRLKLLGGFSILSMAHLGTRAFDSIGGDVVSTTAFITHKGGSKEQLGQYLNLTRGRNEEEKSSAILQAAMGKSEIVSVPSSLFEVIPGSPIAYFAGKALLKSFGLEKTIGQIARPRVGANTTNNEKFLRLWPEISQNKFNKKAISEPDAEASGAKWFPYNKGGPYRKWSGNFQHVVNFERNGRTICEYIDNTLGARVGSTGRVINRNFYFKPGITWSDIKAGGFAARLSPLGFVFDVKGSSSFPSSEDRPILLGLMSSKLSSAYIDALNPTVTIQVGDIARIPYKEVPVSDIVNYLCEIAKSDWDAYETSWDFTALPLLQSEHRTEMLEGTYTTLRAHWQGMTKEMQRLEEENNRIFIDAYGLQDELTPEVPIEEITLTCNPAYRYGIKNDVPANETRLRADTMAEFLSYAVGCMFGRYSLNAAGLILANQGETLADYLARVPEPTFMPDKDNVIPVLDADWFADDITDRFRQFLRVTFGEDSFRQNLRFIEEALGKDIRKYFTKDFYADHVKRYKKRPIYWMFSSPKGTFNALIYIHRYRGDTVSVLLNEYLREFVTKLEGEQVRLNKLADDPTATQGQRTKALKDAGLTAKQLDELNEWEREVIFPLAQAKIEIDLDDGVKANYPKFGTALKKIVGLEVSDE